jgi:hypothetical protein
MPRDEPDFYRASARTRFAHRKMALALTSMSSRVVVASETERRIARRPRQVVPPAQQVPSS